MAIKEGLWDCPSCGREGNKGSSKFCGSCGHPRGDEVKFYLPEDAQAVTDAQALAKAKAGPDWNCTYCGTNNSGLDNNCTSCGGPKSEAESFRQTSSTRPGEQATPPPPPRSAQESAPQNVSSKPGGWVMGLVGILAVVGLVVGLFLFFTSTTEANLQLTDAQWTRTIEVEALVANEYTAWLDEVPSGARILTKNREVRSYNQVKIGEEERTRTVTKEVQVGTEEVVVETKDLGNGFFEEITETRPVYEEQEVTETYMEPIYREDPVYDTRVTYEIDEWVQQRVARAQGSDQNPQWPDTGISGNRYREGDRDEELFLIFAGEEGKTHRYTAKSESDFKAYNLGRTYSVELDFAGNVKTITAP